MKIENCSRSIFDDLGDILIGYYHEKNLLMIEFLKIGNSGPLNFNDCLPLDTIRYPISISSSDLNLNKNQNLENLYILLFAIVEYNVGGFSQIRTIILFYFYL